MNLEIFLIIGALLLFIWGFSTPKSEKRKGGKKLDVNGDTYDIDIKIFYNHHPQTVSGLNISNVMSEEEFVEFLDPVHSDFGKLNRLLNLRYGGELLLQYKVELFHQLGSYKSVYLFSNPEESDKRDYWKSVASSYGITNEEWDH